MPIHSDELHLFSILLKTQRILFQKRSADKGRDEDAHKEDMNKSVLLEEWWGTMPQMRKRCLEIIRQKAKMVEVIDDVWRWFLAGLYAGRTERGRFGVFCPRKAKYPNPNSVKESREMNNPFIRQANQLNKFGCS